MSYSACPSEHHSMVFDKIRNQVYFAAIAAAVDPTSRVLDLGAGLGVLGLEAARLGAKKVYLLDSSAVVRAASDIARYNHLQQHVEIVQCAVAEARLEEKVDLILSVFTGNFMLEEDLLPSLFAARDRLLAPGGTLIPDRGRMYIAAVSLPAYYAKYIDCWGEQEGCIDFSPGREYAVNCTYNDSAEGFGLQLLCEPVCVHDLDFNTASKAECKATVDLTFSQDDICHGCIGWFDMRLGQQWLSTSPLAPATHWSQVFFPFRQPLKIQNGDTATLRLSRPQHGQWSWSVRCKDEQQSHSAAMAAPLMHTDFANRSEADAPSLNERGLAMSMALRAMNGSSTIGSIADQLMAAYPAVFESRQAACEAIMSLARKWAKR